MPDLEEKLKLFQDNRGYATFPSQDNYWQLYCSAKEWLAKNILKHTGIKVACDGEGFYTDHSIDHCNAIIKIANLCLDSVNGTSLSAYEIYLFLVSTLIHDAGMVHGRKDHGANCRKVGEEIKHLLPANIFERTCIYKIAEAHHGRTIFGSKDTIGALKATDTLNNIQFRPALIASLIRLFDEISEDHTRAASYLLDSEGLPEESVIHHAYAASIRSVSYMSKGIEIIYSLAKKDLENKFLLIQDKAKIDVYLFDWICKRFAKINNERQYCASYMWGFLQLEHVTAKIQVLDDELYDIKNITIKGADNFSLDKSTESNIKIEDDYNGETLMQEVFLSEQ